MGKSHAAPARCFWELTRRCELNCLHCRSRAGRPGGEELDPAAALAVAEQLVRLKVKLVVLTGGEPILYPGWDRVARRLAEGGVKVRLFVSGYGFDRQTLRMAAAAGVSSLAISLDGPSAVHEALRPPRDPRGPSSFVQALAALDLAVVSEVKVRAVTQVNRLNVDSLPELYELLAEKKVRHWQVHLCQMTGRAAAHRANLMCEPADLEKIVRVLLRAAREKKVLAPLHCTVGYLTKEEPVLRARETRGRAVWTGCEAGRRTLAITPAGGVKGCTTLPDEFVTASLPERSLADIWADDACFPYTRRWSPEVLGGDCAYCSFAKTCRAGCPATAYAATGSIGVNPYCLRQLRGR